METIEMTAVELGSSGVKVSPMMMGCWGIGGGYTWGDQDEKASLDTIRAALDCGITAFDTAEFYSDGYSEEVLGRGLEGRRNEAVIATKIWTTNMTSDRVAPAVEGMLERLKTDYIDLLQIHWLDPEIPVEQTLKAMEALKTSGKIRAVGVCNHGCRQLEEALSVTDIVANQMCYNLFFRAVEYGISDCCKENNVGILAYSPLAQGLLTGKFTKPEDVNDERARLRFYSQDRPGTVHQESGCEAEIFNAIAGIQALCDDAGIPMGNAAIAWLMRKPEVSAVIVGARNPGQIKRNAEAMELQLPEEIAMKLDELTLPVKEALGPNADPWRTESRVK